MLESSSFLSEPSIKELADFRQEILDLYEKEKNGSQATGHFIDPRSQGKIFKSESLGPREFKLWQAFKLCQAGDEPISFGLDALKSYIKQMGDDSYDLAQSGLRSYVSNKLAFLSGREQLEESRRKRNNQTEN